MPYDIAKGFDGCPYAVVKLTPDGRELAPGGCHQTAIEAGKHLAALQAATDYERGELRAEGYAPNNAMKAEARRGLEWRAEFNRGGTEIGVARARDIMNGRNLSLDTVRRMVSYFARHEVDKQGEGWSPGEPGYPSAGRIAWALWGGNPGRSWANAISESEDKDRAVESEQELRHPGAHDQSVHNPHKGGGGFVRPVAIQRTVETEMAEKFTDEEWKATAYAHRLTPEIKDDKALPSEVPTPEEVKAIQSYQYGSGKFQQSLLHPETEPDSLGEVKALRGVLERNSLQEDTTLYRGIGGAVGSSQMAAKLQEAGVGGIVQSDRFVSSAANSRVASAFGEADLVIKAPAGTKGAYLDRIIYADPSYASVRKYDVQAARKIAIPGRGEAEFVMPPGVKFKVDSIGQNQSNGRTVFEVTVVP